MEKVITMFVSVYSDQSQLMRRIHATQSTVIRFKGGFDVNGVQGWWLTFLPGDGE